MSFLVVVGCDGAGKSTVLEGVIDVLKSEGSEVVCGHWRPQAFSNVEGEHASTADDPHGQVSRGVVGSVAKLGWIWVNWWAGWFKGLRDQAQEGYVFYDRYHGDLVVDPKRYRYGGPAWLAKFWSRTLPQPDLLIFLDAEVDVLLSRKQEVSREVLEQSRRNYLTLVRERGGVVVDAGQAVDQVVLQVLKLVKS